jgi:hypothetical protein
MIEMRFQKLDTLIPYPDAEGLVLTFDIELINHLPETVKIWDIEGQAFVSSSSYPKRYYIGRAKPLSMGVINIPRNSSNNIKVSLELTYEQLEKIERIRAGRRPRFELTLSILFTVPLMSPPSSGLSSIEYIPIMQYTYGGSLYLVKYVSQVMDLRSGSSVFEIGIDNWLDILSKLGFKYVRILEIPIIKPVENEHLKNALDYLDRATKLMLEDMEESLNACRKALEELKSYARDHNLIKDGEIDFRKIYGGENYGDAMEKIFGGLWSLTSIGSHIGRSKMTSRADIEFIITAIYMLLKSIIEKIGATI